MNNTVKNIFVGGVSGALVASIVTFSVLNFYPAQNLATSVTDVNNSQLLEDLLKDGNITEEDLVIAAVDKAKPAVTSIVITKDVPILEKYYEDNANDPFGDFFGSPFQFQIPQYRDSGETEKQTIGGGSGFLVSEDGYIVTNKHVVSDDEADYTVFTNDGGEYTAEIVAKDPLNDLAVLKIEASGLPFLDFADSDGLKVGQSVIAIGSPLMEFTNSVSLGIVSGLGRSVVAGDRFGAMAEKLEGVIQTDAAINPGNSGGPLLNLSGEVVGVNVAVASAENIGFSLPANLAKDVYESVKINGKIVRPYLGVRYVPVTEKLKEANNLSVDYGVLVTKGQTAEELAVIPGSPADKAGLEENDIILEADGKKLDEDNSLSRIIAVKKPGDSVELTLLHDGEEKKVTVTLEEIPE